ncbi:probable mrna export factor elf1 [Ustilago trichophora]|uniref:Elongation factor 3 n=1 Tax=Ustilago trichophora TaxID=86804 RepID=A0A5C3EEA3_9BASI|nr:probable mrna export factor elf1 [Ustilago trichophora]
MSGASQALEGLYKAPSAEECYAAAEKLAAYVNDNGLRVVQSEGILDSLVKASKNKKSGYEREAAAIGLDAIFVKVGGKNAPSPLGAEPWLLNTLPAILELYADKGDVVRQAAETAAGSLLSLVPPEAAPEFLATLYEVLGSGSAKWQAKVGALKLLGRLSASASEQIGDELVELIPYLTKAMHETKAEISKQARKTAIKVCEACLDNKDIKPFIPDLVGCMAQPDAVPECIKKLSGTTFVAEVTGPALAVMVPLLARALNERSQNVQRQAVVVVDNLCKLVRDPHEAAKFLPELTPGVERIEKGASFPEVREHAKSALDTLTAATAAVGASAATEDPKKVFDQQRAAALDAIIAAVQSRVPEEHANVKSDAFALTGLEYLAKSIARLANKRVLHAGAWDDVYVQPYLRRICTDAEAAQAATAELRKTYIELDKARFGNSEEEDDDEAGECLCRTEFSLAYGGLLLLNHTTLKLYRGHRYGIVAANGSGKSTLLKAMRDGKVEGYPSQDEVRTLMVEHSLQGEDGNTPIIDFIANDKKLVGKSREEVADKLREVGFDDEKQKNPVASLSGGWKMKLELARAMLSDAVVYLLDEPTNHLDVASIAWLENFLVTNNQITVVTVSHDSGFLDNVCTDIIHYEKKKLRYYKGNLSDFVKTKPEAKAYYSLAATTVKFSFPPPGSLMGVRSNTRTILKMSGCTFTYPGMSKPSLNDTSCAISLSSRVGVLGPNGAGKSTLIKVLTGEFVPQTGKVEKHPNLRIAMMAQHAFHHLEQHLEKTAVEYIAWRYQDGHDREMTEKASRKMTDEEKAQMETPIKSTTGESRRVEYIVGRQKLKKSYQYEIKWIGYEHRHNAWIPRERLLELGFSKLVQQFDDFEASREGAGSREISVKLIRQHLEAVGLQGEIAQHHAVGGYSGGQKVKVVLAAAMWNNPQVLVLDEPTNYLDRDALGGLATAIRDWAGAVVIISHNMEFVGALCPEIWNVDHGRITSRNKGNVAEGAFLDEMENASTPGASVPGTPMPGSTAASRLASKAGTPVSSAAPTPAGSGDEGDQDMTKFKAKKGKKKLTRNEKKAQEERRRLRLSRWLTYGGDREPDTDDE